MWGGVERVGMCQGRESGCVCAGGKGVCLEERWEGRQREEWWGAGRGRRREHGRVGRMDEVERE